VSLAGTATTAAPWISAWRIDSTITCWLTSGRAHRVPQPHRRRQPPPAHAPAIPGAFLAFHNGLHLAEPILSDDVPIGFDTLCPAKAPHHRWPGTSRRLQGARQHGVRQQAAECLFTGPPMREPVPAAAIMGLLAWRLQPTFSSGPGAPADDAGSMPSSSFRTCSSTLSGVEAPLVRPIVSVGLSGSSSGRILALLAIGLVRMAAGVKHPGLNVKGRRVLVSDIVQIACVAAVVPPHNENHVATPGEVVDRVLSLLCCAADGVQFLKVLISRCPEARFGGCADGRRPS